MFVIGRNAGNASGQALIQPWKQPGHLIGNHTYSHRNYDSITFEEFSADVIHADQILASDLSMPRLFRFPLLNEGNTAPKRDRMREFLATTAIATVTSPSASPSITSGIARNSMTIFQCKCWAVACPTRS